MARLTKRKFSNISLSTQWWDYGRNAACFITICIKKEAVLCKIVDKKMLLSRTGMVEKNPENCDKY